MSSIGIQCGFQDEVNNGVNPASPNNKHFYVCLECVMFPRRANQCVSPSEVKKTNSQVDHLVKTFCIKILNSVDIPNMFVLNIGTYT